MLWEVYQINVHKYTKPELLEFYYILYLLQWFEWLYESMIAETLLVTYFKKLRY